MHIIEQQTIIQMASMIMNLCYLNSTTESFWYRCVTIRWLSGRVPTEGWVRIIELPG